MLKREQLQRANEQDTENKEMRAIEITDAAAGILERAAALDGLDEKTEAELILVNHARITGIPTEENETGKPLFAAVLERIKQEHGDELGAGPDNRALYINLATNRETIEGDGLLTLIRAARFTIDNEPEGAAAAKAERAVMLDALNCAEEYELQQIKADSAEAQDFARMFYNLARKAAETPRPEADESGKPEQ